MLTFLAWLLLAVVAWPLALVAIVVYPFVWLLSIPFRAVGLSMRGVFSLLEALLGLPTRLIQGPNAAA
jgi:hypothetical protein